MNLGIESKNNEIGELAAALAKAYLTYKPLKKSAENPFYKSSYATLADQWDSVREALAQNGLAFIQTTEMNSELVLKSTLIHSSGQQISCLYPVNPKPKSLKDKQGNVIGEESPDPQSIGSAISYARRYSMAAMLGLAAEDDDDGNAASNVQNKASGKPQEQKAEAQGETGNKEEKTTGRQSNSMKALWAMANKLGMDDKQVHTIVKAMCNYDSLKDMTEADFTKVNSALTKTLNSATKIAQELGNNITLDHIAKFVNSKPDWSWNEALNFYKQDSSEFASQIFAWINDQMQPELDA